MAIDLLWLWWPALLAIGTAECFKRYLMAQVAVLLMVAINTACPTQPICGVPQPGKRLHDQHLSGSKEEGLLWLREEAWYLSLHHCL